MKIAVASLGNFHANYGSQVKPMLGGRTSCARGIKIMTKIKSITRFEELELFPLDGYESHFSYFLEQSETENSIVFKLTKKKREKLI